MDLQGNEVLETYVELRFKASNRLVIIFTETEQL